MNIRKTLLCVTLGLAVSAATLAQEAVPPDRSLASGEYVEAGLPSKDRVWSGDDLATAAEALARLAESEPGHLPRFESPRSGEVFARLTTAENLKISADESLPLGVRFPQAIAHLKATSELLKVYLGSYLKKATGTGEMVELMGSQLRSTRTLLRLVDEQLPTLDPNAADYQTRMAGLDQMRHGLATMVAGVLTSASDREGLSPALRLRLVGYLDAELPAMIPYLTADSRAEAVRRLETLAGGDEPEELKAALAQLLGKAKEAATAKAVPE